MKGEVVDVYFQYRATERYISLLIILGGGI